MENILKYLLIVLSATCCTGIAVSQDPIYFKDVNTSNDEYGAAFRTTTEGIELWVTTNENAPNKRSKKIKRYFYQGQKQLSSDKYIFKYAENLKTPINDDVLSSNTVFLNGVSTFPFCTDWGIFTSNRYFDNKDYQNDLYEIALSPEGTVDKVKRLDVLNTEFWDDSPSLSDDGRFLYFSSDRKSPGQGKTDIFLSERIGNSWSIPIALDEINTNEFSEQTPFIANDGYLYFSTNQTKDSTYDIWRVKINLETGRPVNEAVPVTFPGVNLSGSNESHPIFSPGGAWFIFSSNREENGTKDLDLYYVKAPIISDPLDLNILVQTRSYNPETRTYEDAVNPLATKVNILDVRSMKKLEIISDSKGNAWAEIERFGGEKPSDDGRIRKFIVTAISPNPKFVAPVDTLFFDIFCNDKINHVLTLVDTAIYNNPECRQDFPVEKVQFFVSAYWCPTTWKFRSKAPCASVFLNDDCLEVTWEKPEKPCDNNDLYRYNLEFTDPKVVRSRQAGLCADMEEARKNGEKYAIKVDSAITKFIEIMKSAMQNQCVLKALSKGKKINVEVIGWTDPGGIDMKCLYTGHRIDFNDTNKVRLKFIERKDYLLKRNRILENGTAFRVSNEKGNEMLADLRAYYTALLLDEVWKDSVDTYRRARESNMINLIAWGAGIDRSKNLAKAAQRSVNVIVEVPLTGGERIESFKPDPGRVVDLSVKCGRSPCKPTPSALINKSQQKIDTRKEPADITPKVLNIFPDDDGVLGNCWSILLGSFDDEGKANELINRLLSKQITTRKENFKETESNKEYFRVKLGCWQDQDKAKDALKKLIPVIRDFNLTRKPSLHK